MASTHCRKDEANAVKINANIHDKTWWKGLIVSVLILAASVFFLVLSIAYGEVVGMVVSGLCTALFGFIVVASLMPGQLVSMQMVKDRTDANTTPTPTRS